MGKAHLSRSVSLSCALVVVMAAAIGAHSNLRANTQRLLPFGTLGSDPYGSSAEGMRARMVSL